MPPQISPRRVRLGIRLRELRAARYRSASALGRDLGWQQSRVSKLERGAQLPTPEDLDAWVTATGASPAVRAELADLLTSARVEYSVWSDAYRTGAIIERQAELGRLEAQAGLIREYQPAMIPGLVQTPAYARELLSIPGGPVLTGSTPEDIEGLVAERIKRQELLYQPTRGVQIVLGQAALWTHFGSVNTLLGQLDRLVTLAELASVELGIVPVANPSPIMPLAGFSLHDTDVLYVETLTDEHRIEDPEQIAAHVKAFDLLRDAAATGEDAVALIQRVAAGLR